MSAAPVEVVVIGGGPAGAAAARLLAAWGHAVQVLAKPADDTRALGESLPPSCRKLFDLIGVTGDVEAAGFLRSTGNTVWWGGRDSRAVRFAGGGIGWQVRRNELDGLLLRLASQAGAAVETGAVVRQVDLPSASHSAGAAESSTRYLAGGAARSLRARFVLDCSAAPGSSRGTGSDGTRPGAPRWPSPRCGPAAAGGASTTSRTPWSRATGTAGRGRSR